VTAFSKVKVGLALCCFIVAAGCAQKEGPASVATDPGVAISCIAVMPVQPSGDYEEIISPAEKRILKDGSLVMDGLLKQYLTGKANVRFVDQGQGAAKKTDGVANNLANARRIADQFKCNAVLETTLSQYADRVGGPYGAKDPAAVTFAYKLYETGSGKVICHGRFDEKQQSVMDNLLTLPKAQNRGMTWLTAEELLREGVKERLGQCSYLEGK
jgi:hypothetical protein